MFPIMILRIVQKGLNSRLGEGPGTGIKGFLLTPNDGLGVRVHVEVFLKLLPREGVELLDTSDGCVLEAIIGSVFVEGSVNLTSTENDTLNLFRVANGIAVLWVGDDPLELRFAGKFLNWRPSQRVTEERLGEEQDEGLKVLAIISH